MNSWHDVEIGEITNPNAIIEVPKLSRIKYELDKKTGLMKFDRVLYSPMHYPTNYGFIPQTLWEDNDPLDILIISHESIDSKTLVKCRVIGMLEMIDGGEDDVKILAVPEEDPRFKNTKNIDDLEPHLLDEIKHFFKVYKDLQNKKVEVGEWKNREEAIKAIEKSIVLYKEKYGK